MRRISIQECPKIYMLETHRSKTPESTLQFVEHMKDTLDMFFFQDATALDRVGIPVFICHRLRPDQSKTSHTGKGLSLIQAQVSLTMESIERYCSEFRDEYLPNLITGTYNDLRKTHNILDPHALILSIMHHYDHDAEIHWVWGTDLIQQENILVPACTVYHPFHRDGCFLMSTHTNGIASGNTLEEAITHGLAEVIERDAWSIAQYNRHFSDALYVDDTPENDFIVDIIRRYGEADIEIVAKDITSDIGVPVIAAFSRDLVFETLMPVDGFGAHLDPKVAAVRALLEIATTRALFINKYGIDGMKDSMPGYYREADENDPRFYATDRKGLHELVSDYTDDIRLDIQKIMRKLKERGLEQVIAVDLTRQDIGIPTVRMIVPGMEATCFDRSRRGDRLMNALQR